MMEAIQAHITNAEDTTSMTIDELARMVSEMKTELKDDIASVREAIAEQRVYRETEAARCPYRETISKAANNTDRILRLEQGGVIGGGGTVLAAVAYGVGKLAGWW